MQQAQVHVLQQRQWHGLYASDASGIQAFPRQVLAYKHCDISERRIDSPLCGCCCLPLQNAVAAEREERVAEDDEIVAAVNDYTRALQDGLRILANS
jgi:hypothetical protein